MKPVLLLTAFYETVSNDVRIGASHISLYMALFQKWGINNFENPVAFSRHEIMPMAKIFSRTTYHKCLHDLVERGYLRYIPSFNPFEKSLAFFELSINN